MSNCFIIPEKNVEVCNKDKDLYWIYSPKGKIVFKGNFYKRRDCIEFYTWWNTIQWKWKPSLWWKCKKINS